MGFKVSRNWDTFLGAPGMGGS